MYKCAIVGVSGGRAKGLAEAYRINKRGRLAAVSTRTRSNLDAFGEAFGVDSGGRYTDFREMFEKEKPDLVHVNTPPTVRLEVLQAAQNAKIPGVIVEKPVACQGEDYMALAEFTRSCAVKVAVNHQLHFHPRRQLLQKIVRDGGIGDIRFIEASSGMNLAYQGTHTLQAISAFNLDGKPVTVFGQVSGSKGLQETPKHHYAPDQCIASINYDNGLNAVLRCGENAPRVAEARPINQHKRIAVYGTRGYVYWTMWSWETSRDGKRESGEHEYKEEDIMGQASMTEALFDWIEDDKQIHPLNLSDSLRDFNIILGTYMSGLNHQVIELPVEPAAGLIDELRLTLDAAE